VDAGKANVLFNLMQIFHLASSIYLELAHLFVNVPRLRDREVAFSVFESSYHLLLLLV